MATSWQKVYVNHVHSNFLLEQLAAMWKEEILCDAVVIHDSGLIKVHRVVLRAASQMLQSSDASGVTFLDIKMPPGVGKDSVMEFLTYLYEGILTLNCDNIQAIWNIATYLQVNELEKCCKDFADNVLKDKTVCVLEDRRLKSVSMEPKPCDRFSHFKSTKLIKTRDMAAQSLKRGCENSKENSAKRLRGQSSEAMSSQPTSHIDSSSAHLSQSLSATDSLVPLSDTRIVDPDTSTWSQDSESNMASPSTSSPYPVSMIAAPGAATSSSMIEHNPSVVVKTENLDEGDEHAVDNEDWAGDGKPWISNDTTWGDGDPKNMTSHYASWGNDPHNTTGNDDQYADWTFTDAQSTNRQRVIYPQYNVRKKAKCWEYFEEVIVNRTKKTKCTLCGRLLAFHGATSSMMNHLLMKHDIGVTQKHDGNRGFIRPGSRSNHLVCQTGGENSTNVNLNKNSDFGNTNH